MIIKLTLLCLVIKRINKRKRKLILIMLFFLISYVLQLDLNFTYSIVVKVWEKLRDFLGFFSFQI